MSDDRPRAGTEPGEADPVGPETTGTETTGTEPTGSEPAGAADPGSAAEPTEEETEADLAEGGPSDDEVTEGSDDADEDG